MGDLVNNQQNDEEILNNIQSLQQIEQELFSSLETNNNLSRQEQEKIIQKINRVSNMRINLYKTLGGINNFYKDALQSSVHTLKEQAMAISIVENELNRSKRRLEVLELEKNNKIRLVEINNYYGEKYAEHSQLMKIVIFTLIPIIILAFLNNKGFLPNTIYYILIIIISIIGSIYFWKTFVSILMRDNMNYDEYNWYFDPSTAPTGSSNSEDPWAISGISTTCIGEYCCSPDQIFDYDTNKCVASTSTTTTETFTTNVEPQKGEGLTESMVTQVLTKQQPEKFKSDYSLISDYKPYN